MKRWKNHEFIKILVSTMSMCAFSSIKNTISNDHKKRSDTTAKVGINTWNS